jgi:hypothetical protein
MAARSRSVRRPPDDVGERCSKTGTLKRSDGPSKGFQILLRHFQTFLATTILPPKPTRRKRSRKSRVDQSSAACLTFPSRSRGVVLKKLRQGSLVSLANTS